ncbi:MAG: 50S ribosomal protein L3 [Candidatus Absconditabacteria bacterium]|nr:50S ribosomal protein L3 [Candidatus Absconditabacteria bacterium]MDD3868403.1 50S ribosomal protein L3 [Candidatus Absconditabacteria bacterium]MDD4714073.1 50S ribosomal protein L3 [Candidatus Absconditabacteria bacterium]
MHTKGGLVVSKKEMTKVRVDGKLLPVTLVEVLPQKVLRYKTTENDGYQAVVVGVGEKETKKEKGQKLAYDLQTEFFVDDSFVTANEIGKVLDVSFLEGITTVEVKGTSKGKGFQGAIKRFHLKGGPKTHGSKFHRHVGSMGNRKPRRTMKNHPHAGHMGDEAITLKKIQLLDTIQRDSEQLLVVRGSLPGGRNSKLKFIIE